MPLPAPHFYQKKISALLTPAEKKLFKKLSTPLRIQDYIDRVAINWKDTHRSPRFSLKAREVQCIEGALIAAAALAYHGRPPLLMDFQTIREDEDHVVAIFQENGYWGAISKTNHAILGWRDPIYKTPRELAMSYFHEYFMHDGRKSMTAYSTPFDLRRYAPEKWITSAEELFWLDEALDKTKHYSPLPPHLGLSRMRKASKLEVKTLSLTHYKKNYKKKK